MPFDAQNLSGIGGPLPPYQLAEPGNVVPPANANEWPQSGPFYQDAAGTMPCTMAGQNVERWKASIGGVDFIDTSVSTPPTYVSGGGLNFDGSDGQDNLSALVNYPPLPYVLFIKANLSASFNMIVALGDEEGGIDEVAINGGFNAAILDSASDVVASAGVASPSTGVHVFAVKITAGPTYALYLDGVNQSAVTNPGTGARDAAGAGSMSFGGVGCMNITHLAFAINLNDLTDDQVATISASL